MWKTTLYLGRRDRHTGVPALRTNDAEVTDSTDKARLLMETFIPPTGEPIPEAVVAPKELLWEPITESEIMKALRNAKKRTAPDQDGLPTLVWHNLWPYLSTVVTNIFTGSINLGHYPQQWKTAKIAVLRKPGKSTYTSAAAYRPISLLNTLGKLLEAVVARRLSFFAEKYKLLPDT